MNADPRSTVITAAEARALDDRALGDAMARVLSEFESIGTAYRDRAERSPESVEPRAGTRMETLCPSPMLMDDITALAAASNLRLQFRLPVRISVDVLGLSDVVDGRPILETSVEVEGQSFKVKMASSLSTLIRINERDDLQEFVTSLAGIDHEQVRVILETPEGNILAAGDGVLDLQETLDTILDEAARWAVRGGHIGETLSVYPKCLGDLEIRNNQTLMASP